MQKTIATEMKSHTERDKQSQMTQEFYVVRRQWPTSTGATEDFIEDKHNTMKYEERGAAILYEGRSSFFLLSSSLPEQAFRISKIQGIEEPYLLQLSLSQHSPLLHQQHRNRAGSPSCSFFQQTAPAAHLSLLEGD